MQQKRKTRNEKVKRQMKKKTLLWKYWVGRNFEYITFASFAASTWFECQETKSWFIRQVWSYPIKEPTW